MIEEGGALCPGFAGLSFSELLNTGPHNEVFYNTVKDDSTLSDMHMWLH